MISQWVSHTHSHTPGRVSQAQLCDESDYEQRAEITDHRGLHCSCLSAPLPLSTHPPSTSISSFLSSPTSPPHDCMTQVQEHWQQGRNARNSPDAGHWLSCWREVQTFCWTQHVRRQHSILGTYLVVLAVPVHHPVLAVGADLQLEVGDVVRLLRLL